MTILKIKKYTEGLRGLPMAFESQLLWAKVNFHGANVRGIVTRKYRGTLTPVGHRKYTCDYVYILFSFHQAITLQMYCI